MPTDRIEVQVVCRMCLGKGRVLEEIEGRECRTDCPSCRNSPQLSRGTETLDPDSLAAALIRLGEAADGLSVADQEGREQPSESAVARWEGAAHGYAEALAALRAHPDYQEGQ